MSKLIDKQYKMLGRYMSTYDFVACNQLEKEAEKVLGKNWEAEDDATQIQDIIDEINPDGFVVETIMIFKLERWTTFLLLFYLNGLTILLIMFKTEIIIFIIRRVNMLMKGRRVVYERYNSNARQCLFRNNG